MVLRAELEPQLTVAEQRYPEILCLISEYDEASDADDRQKIQQVIAGLRQLTSSNVSEDDLFEYYEAGSKEELAIRLALPAPTLAYCLTNEELLEVLRRLNDSVDVVNARAESPFAEQVRRYYLHDYYHQLLRLSFPNTYNYQYFNRQKRPDGSYYELTSQEQAALLLA